MSCIHSLICKHICMVNRCHTIDVVNSLDTIIIFMGLLALFAVIYRICIDIGSVTNEMCTFFKLIFNI